MTRKTLTLAAAALALVLAVVVITGRPSGVLTAAVRPAATGSVLARRAWASSEPGGAPRARAMLIALLLVAVVQFHAFGGRIAGDGVSYYVYVRSLVKDADLDFTNEYTHY